MYYKTKLDNNRFLIVVIKNDKEKTFIVEKDDRLYRFITKNYKETNFIMQRIFKP